jgi:ribose-phosphate pyrophosphokinase
MARFNDIKLLAGRAHPALAAQIAEHIGVPLVELSIGSFSDGEIRVTINDSVRGADCFLIQPTCAPANDNLVELLIMVDALMRASADRITVVMPYFGYARQDRKTRGREPITAKLVANLIATAKASRVLTMDLHAGQIQGFFDLPVDHLSAVPLIADYFADKGLTDVIAVSPDHGGIARTRDLADRLRAPIGIIDKRRPAPNKAEVMNIVGEVEGKTVVLIDDLIDTAGTIAQAADILKERGAVAVYGAATHGVLSGPAMERISDSALAELVVTNTIPLGDKTNNSRLTVLSVAPMLGEAILRIHQDLSVSKMFSDTGPGFARLV